MTDVKKCPHCGKALHKDAQYCMYCMASLHPKKDITPKVAVRGKWLILLWGLLPLLAAIGLMYLLDRDRGEEVPVQLENKAAMHEIIGESEITNPTDMIQEEIVPELDGTEPVTESVTQTVQPEEEKKPVIPTESQPIQEPPESTGPATQPDVPAKCDHVYTAANCLTPTTCTLCGNTVGTADLQAHDWKPVTSVVHHPEVGHYETQETSYKKNVYLCFFCGYNQDGYDTLDLLRQHMVVHANAHNYEVIIALPDLLADTREVWETKKEQQWVVDEKAYDETVITGYICALCEKQKGPDA